jgi:ferredoxin
MSDALMFAFICFFGAAAAAGATPNNPFIKALAVVVAMRVNGEVCEGCGVCEGSSEVELDVMVSRPGGGQFPAHETALISSSRVANVSPGSVIETYYRPGDETAIAVRVPQG